MSASDDLNACAAIVQKADPDRFAAAMASPVAARRVLLPLYAFNVEVARAPWVTQEPMIAEMRLQWWRDALEEIAQGHKVRRHEVVTPLAAILAPEDATRLDALVAARRWDIHKEAFEDEAHFDAYLGATAATVMQVAARSLAGVDACPDLATEHALHRLGVATGLARFLQAVPALESRGRIPLVDGRAESIAARALAALSDCPGVSRLRRLLPRATRAAAFEAFQTAHLLAKVARTPVCVAEGTLVTPPLRRSLLLWKWAIALR